MADYKTLHGTNIETVSSDPSDPVSGQVWYNSTSQTLKGFTSNPAGSWASGGNMNTARVDGFQGGGSVGIQTSSIAFGDGPPPSGIAESYNGSSWTEVADLNTGRYGVAGAGVSNTSAIAAAGENYPQGGGEYFRANAETWNGSSWTEVGDLNTARNQSSGAGIITSALLAGGQTSTANGIVDVETWDGSSWTEVANLNVASRLHGGAGASNTSALMAGGNVTGTPNTAAVETWNGTAWTEVADLNTARYGCGGCGTVTAALMAGGDASPLTVNTEIYNGTAWTEVGNLPAAKNYLAASGTTTSALSAGGKSSTAGVATTEEFTSPLDATVSFDAS